MSWVYTDCLLSNKANFLHKGREAKVKIWLALEMRNKYLAID